MEEKKIYKPRKKSTKQTSKSTTKQSTKKPETVEISVDLPVVEIVKQVKLLKGKPYRFNKEVPESKMYQIRRTLRRS